VAMDVRNQAENAIECFRFAKGNEETFIACLKRTTADSESDFIETGVDTHIYALDKGGYEIVITVMVDDAGEMTGFEFVAAYENKIEDPIYDFDFPKPSNEGGSEQ